MVQAICWTLIHSLWQGVLLAICAGLVILCTGRSAPAVRYRWLGGLSILFLSGLISTLCFEWNAVASSHAGSGGGWTQASWLADYCNTHASILVGGWLVVAVMRWLRLGFCWRYIQRIKQESRVATGSWVDQIDVLSRRLGMRRIVQVVESGLAKVPMVIGQLRPIIVVPLGLINQLPASEMEAVLLHELAHIRRYDHLANLIQQIAECFLFFNPGFLWVSALLREERENCCDDVAIVHTGDKVSLVRALVRFSEHSQRPLALGFPGNRRQLLHRVIRISRDRNRALNAGQRACLAAALLGLLWLVSAGMGGNVIQRDKMENRHNLPQVSPKLLAVLQSRQRVSENMEWVEAQLTSLRQKKQSAVAEKSRVVSRRNGMRGQARQQKDFVPSNAGLAALPGKQAQQLAQAQVALMDESSILQTRLQDLRTAEQVLVEQQETHRKLQQLQNADQQGQINRREAEANSRRAQQIREMAEQNRVKEELLRSQALRDRQQAQQDWKQTQRNREAAEQDREQAERDREKTEQDRLMAERDRIQAETGMRQMQTAQEQALRDQQQALRNRQLAIQDQQSANADRGQNKPHL